MTINKAISKVDALKINAFTSAQKAEWLTELEGKIYIEVEKSPADVLYPKNYYDYIYEIGTAGLVAGAYYIVVATKDYKFTLPDALVDGDILIVNTDSLKAYVNDEYTAAVTQSAHGAETDLTTSFASAADIDMLVPAPYENLYVLYVCAMIDFYENETESYANSYTMFNAAYLDFRKYWIRITDQEHKYFKLW